MARYLMNVQEFVDSKIQELEQFLEYWQEEEDEMEHQYLHENWEWEDRFGIFVDEQ